MDEYLVRSMLGSRGTHSHIDTCINYVIESLDGPMLGKSGQLAVSILNYTQTINFRSIKLFIKVVILTQNSSFSIMVEITTYYLPLSEQQVGRSTFVFLLNLYYYKALGLTMFIFMFVCILRIHF